MADRLDFLRSQLGKITECLLDPESDPGQLRDAGIELHGLLSELSGVGDDSGGADDGRESRLPTGGVLIPEEVSLTASLADLGREFVLLPADHGESGPIENTRRRIDLGSFLHLNARTEASDLRPAVFKAPENIGSCNRLLILTKIRIFEDFVLDDYDSGITVPAVVHDVGEIEPGDSLQLSYESGPQPGTRTMKNPPPSD